MKENTTYTLKVTGAQSTLTDEGNFGSGVEITNATFSGEKIYTFKTETYADRVREPKFWIIGAAQGEESEEPSDAELTSLEQLQGTEEIKWSAEHIKCVHAEKDYRIILASYVDNELKDVNISDPESTEVTLQLTAKPTRVRAFVWHLNDITPLTGDAYELK